MKKIRETLRDHSLMRYSIFIIFTVSLLVVIYTFVTNFVPVMNWFGGHASIFLRAISPLIIGIVLAYLINPMASFLDEKVMIRLSKPKDDPDKEKKRAKKTRLVSTLLSYLIIVAIIISLLFFFTSLIIGRVVIGGLSSLYTSILEYIQTHEQMLADFISQIQSETSIFGFQISDITSSAVDWLQNSGFNFSDILTIITGLGSSIVSFIIGIIISIYLVLDKDFFIGLVKKLGRLIVSDDRAERIENTATEVNGVLSSFVKGVFIDAVIVAVLSSTALTILGVDFGVFIGIFAGICNIIPYFGPIIGMIPAFLIGAFTDSILQGVLAVVLLFIIQQIDGNFIYPKVVGSSTGLHPLFVLLAVAVIGSYGGLMGMIIAVPIAGIVAIFIKKWVLWKEERKVLKANKLKNSEQ